MPAMLCPLLVTVAHSLIFVSDVHIYATTFTFSAYDSVTSEAAPQLTVKLLYIVYMLPW